MISERALKGRRDKLHLCTSLTPPNLIPTGSLARLLQYTRSLNTNTDLLTPDVEAYKDHNTSACYQQLLQVTRVFEVCTVCLSGCCVKPLGCYFNMGFYYWQQVSQPSKIIFMSASHSSHIRTRSFSCSLCKQAKAPGHVMYCIDCCRASAAPLAPGSANKCDLFLCYKVLYRSNITRYYHRFKYILHEFATHVFRASIFCVIQFGTPDNFGGTKPCSSSPIIYM